MRRNSALGVQRKVLYSHDCSVRKSPELLHTIPWVPAQHLPLICVCAHREGKGTLIPVPLHCSSSSPATERDQQSREKHCKRQQPPNAERGIFTQHCQALLSLGGGSRVTAELGGLVVSEQPPQGWTMPQRAPGTELRDPNSPTATCRFPFLSQALFPALEQQGCFPQAAPGERIPSTAQKEPCTCTPTVLMGSKKAFSECRLVICISFSWSSSLVHAFTLCSKVWGWPRMQNNKLELNEASRPSNRTCTVQIKLLFK